MKCVVNTIFAFETTAVEANVPVSGVVNKLQETRDDGIESVA
jgi:hypothetical protein